MRAVTLGMSGHHMGLGAKNHFGDVVFVGLQNCTTIATIFSCNGYAVSARQPPTHSKSVRGRTEIGVLTSCYPRGWNGPGFPKIWDIATPNKSLRRTAYLAAELKQWGLTRFMQTV